VGTNLGGISFRFGMRLSPSPHVKAGQDGMLRDLALYFLWLGTLGFGGPSRD
jgi:hypothetical protein